jgi:hypothetical protein
MSFKPFSSNPEKQIRYEKYLVCVKNNRADALPILQPKSMTEWEKDREKVRLKKNLKAIVYQEIHSKIKITQILFSTASKQNN